MAEHNTSKENKNTETGFCGTIEAEQLIGQELEKFFTTIKKTNELNDKAFGTSDLLKRTEVQETIAKSLAKNIDKDFNSKLGHRPKVMRVLFTLLTIQIIFMNIIIGFIFFSQLISVSWTIKLEHSLLTELTELAKWYTTAVLAELITVFCYIVKIVFAKPSLS